MKIGLNGQNLFTNQPAGPEVFTYNLYKNIAQTDKENEYTVYLTKTPSPQEWGELTLGNQKFKFKVLSKFPSWTQVSLALELFINKVDTYFTPVHTIPGIHPPTTKIVSMIHGIEYDQNKNLKGLNKIIHPLILWWVIKFSNRLIVPSKATFESIKSLNWPFINTNKIHIIHEGVSNIFTRKDENEVKNTLQKFNIDPNTKYFFMLSTIQPRKNYPKSIEAFSKFVKSANEYENFKLIIAGKKGWEYKETLESPQKFGVQDNVIFLDHVETQDLPALFSGSQAFVSFSLQEGFGLPLIEALACQTKALVSNISAFKEIGEEFPIYCDTQNTDEMVEGFEKILKHDVDFEKLRIHLQKFTWNKTAQSVISLLTLS